ncbi:hypothetical protein CEXT_596101 [Caerostris extrusa]|uniref:Uncharacterized protein n=1 Tax=Caerostris extrusa TaxID=172846 RepID=A0AAV4SN92_CAEEX|nr:hypothetical protein CEXT_596101 [Caerostris extrusa]
MPRMLSLISNENVNFETIRQPENINLTFLHFHIYPVIKVQRDVDVRLWLSCCAREWRAGTYSNGVVCLRKNLKACNDTKGGSNFQPSR